MTSPADTCDRILRYIERYRARDRAPPRREFTENGAVVARVEGVTADGVTELTVANRGHAWRLNVFGRTRRIRLVVTVAVLEVE